MNADQIAALYAPFPLKDHSIREGHKNKAGTKIQWFVYLDRWQIQRRLDELFPGAWSFKIVDIYRGSYVSALGEMTIDGVTRSDVGESTPWGDGIAGNDEKGAVTGAFRRCASGFGLGAYLYDGPVIRTPSYAKGDWDAMRAQEKEAKLQFAAWYKNFPGV